MRARQSALTSVFASLLLAFASDAVPAQEVPPPSAAPVPRASPSLPGDHWAVRAAVRAEALGLIPRFLPAQRSVPRAAVAAALREAAAGARGEVPGMAAEAAGWWARFQEEFPESAQARERSPLILGSSAGVGAESRSGAVAPGSGIFERRTTVEPLPDRRELFAAGVLAVQPSPHLSLLAEPWVGTDGASLPRWDVTAGAGPLAVSVGEAPVGYAYGRGGGVVLSGEVHLPRIQIETTRSVSLPGPFRYLGPISLHGYLSRLTEERHPGDPYFMAMRGAFRPHPRFTAAVNRASIFGGDSVPLPTTPRNVGRMLLGLLTGGFENQVVSADFRWRVPSDRVLPVTLYLEWGAEDAAGAWWDAPGRVVGGYFPVAPGAAWLALGAEYAEFAPPCCGNGPWYLHAGHPGGWVAEDQPLGHPLGGEGRELLLYATADVAASRLRLDGSLARRDRGRAGYDLAFLRAGNLYAPERAGGSTAATLDASWRATPRMEVRLSTSAEAGDGWRTGEMVASTSILF